MLTRLEAIEALAQARAARPGTLTVATMRTQLPWHEAGQGESDHIDAMGCMGSASSLGLGLALARPERRVMVFDGDGSLLMQLGSIVTIAGAAPRNFYHFLFENGVHETSGGQPIPAAGRVDFRRLAEAAGYAAALRFDNAASLTSELGSILDRTGPVFVSLVIARDERDIGWPAVTLADEITALRKRLGAR